MNAESWDMVVMLPDDHSCPVKDLNFNSMEHVARSHPDCMATFQILISTGSQKIACPDFTGFGDSKYSTVSDFIGLIFLHIKGKL